MSLDQLDQFINQLLEHSSNAEALRDLTTRNLLSEDSSLLSTVYSLLLEQQLESQFNPEGYPDNMKRNSILDRVNHLKDVLDRNLVDQEHPHYISVQICLKYIHDGYALNRYALEYLNQIYKHYA